MDQEWLLSAIVIVAASSVFGQFETRVSPLKRFGKWAIYLVVSSLIKRRVGRPWTFGWIIGLPLLAISVHVGWCRKHGINPINAEPKDRYYRLRGWTVEE